MSAIPPLERPSLYLVPPQVQASPPAAQETVASGRLEAFRAANMAAVLAIEAALFAGEDLATSPAVVAANERVELLARLLPRRGFKTW